MNQKSIDGGYTEPESKTLLRNFSNSLNFLKKTYK